MRLNHARNVKHLNYTLGNATLQETESHPYLGVSIRLQPLQMTPLHLYDTVSTHVP